MLNMKKGLAIVLAAATALTFAPVSSLGLTGVVEAQAATPFTDYSDSTFQNVPDTVYIRDTKDASVTLSPSWVVKKDGTSAENGSELYYQVTDSEPTLSDFTYEATSDKYELVANKFVNTTVTGTNSTTSATMILFDTSKKGSVTLKKDAADEAFVDGREVYIAAYKLNTKDNNYSLVGYKKIAIKTYTNATYDVSLSQDPVTLSLGVQEDSGDITVSKVFDESGNGINATNWTIASAYGEGINQTGTGDNIIAKYQVSGGKLKFNALRAGSSKVTVIATDNTKVAIHTIDLEVLGTSQYVIKATVDGTNNSAQIGFKNTTVTGDYSPVVLDVKSNNTYDLASHMYKNNDGIVLSYESNNSKNTVDATTGLVKATTVTDEFVVTVTGKLNGKTVAQTKVYFKVNALPFNQLTVTGADKDQATVLNETEYAFTKSRVDIASMTEEKLAASQIKYVQIDVTGKEASDPTEALNIVSTSGAIVTASLVGQNTGKKDDGTTGGAFKGVSNAGVITVNKGFTSGVAVIKLVSNPTTTTALTTSYIYVVVDKADPTIAAASAYTIGTDKAAKDNKWYESDIDFSAIQGAEVSAKLLDTVNDDKTAEQNLYAADDSSKFINDVPAASAALATGNKTADGKYYHNTTVHIATAENKTEHVLLSYNAGAGTAYKVVTITSVPGVHNLITKIEDATTGKTIYTSDMGTQIPEIVLDGNTTLKVTLAYSIDKNKTDVNIS